MKPRFSHDLVRGAPINVGGRVFVPEARVTTLSAREAVFSERAVSAMGFVIRRVMPTALIEQTPGGERRYVVEDATGRTLWVHDPRSWASGRSARSMRYSLKERIRRPASRPPTR